MATETPKLIVLDPLQLFISVFRCFSFIFICLFLNFKDKIKLSLRLSWSLVHSPNTLFSEWLI